MTRRTDKQVLEERIQQSNQQRINDFVSQSKIGPRYLNKIDWFIDHKVKTRKEWTTFDEQEQKQIIRLVEEKFRQVRIKLRENIKKATLVHTKLALVRKPEVKGDLVRLLKEAFSLDSSVEEACAYAGINQKQYYELLKQFPELKEQFDSARQLPILIARDTVIRNIAKDGNLALKYLEKKKQDEFGERSTINVYSLEKIALAIQDLANDKQTENGS